MGFIKIKEKRAKEDTIINTDMISRIIKLKNGCGVFFSSGSPMTAYFEYDGENAKKIFEEIGVSL